MPKSNYWDPQRCHSVWRLVYGLVDRGSLAGRISDGIFVLRHHFQTGSGAHSVFYPMGTGRSYFVGKAAGS